MYDKTFVLRLLGTLAIIVGLSNSNELGCRTLKNISSLEPAYVHIDVKPGDDFTVTCCVINNASCLSIIDKNSNQILDLEEVNTSIKKVTIRNIEYKKYGYQFICKCNEKGFKITFVSVGTAPKQVKNFICVVIDFLEMECIVELVYESIETSYLFLLDGLKIPAKQISYGDNPRYTFKLTQPEYNIDRSSYNFTLNSFNSMGSFSEYKFVQPYKIVKPQLRNVKLTNITSNGALLVWDVLNSAAYTKYPTGGLFFIISIKAEKYNFFQKDFLIENHNDHFWVKISNLYPYVEYRVHIRAKAKFTDDNESMWSNEFEQTFRTTTKIPNKPPYIEVGNFYIDPENEDISLFWRQIPEYEHNGPNFSYKISKIVENGKEIAQNLDINTNFARLYIDWKNTSEYAFQLKSLNKEGVSQNASVLTIGPRYTNITHDKQRQALTNVYNKTYTVSWIRPTNYTVLSGFTLFWCNAKIESMDECEGPMEFLNLDKNVLSYNTNISNTTNFALSENYYDNTYSSGMMWFRCSKNSEIDSFQVMFDDPLISDENSIIIRWLSECWRMSIIDRHIVTYCEENTNFCKNETIPKNANSHTINGLKSSYSYKITITSILKTGLEVMSKSITGTTKIAKNTTKIIIFACSAVIGIVVFIMLALMIKKRIDKMMNIKIVLPDDTSNKENLKGDLNGNNNPFYDYKTICTEVLEKKIPWDICTTPPQITPEMIVQRPKIQESTLTNEYSTLEEVSCRNLPTSDRVQNNQEREFSSEQHNYDTLNTSSEDYISSDQASRSPVSGLSSMPSTACSGYISMEQVSNFSMEGNKSLEGDQLLMPNSDHRVVQTNNIPSNKSNEYISMDQASRPSTSVFSMIIPKPRAYQTIDQLLSETNECNHCESLEGQHAHSDLEFNDDLINDETTSNGCNVVNDVHQLKLPSVPLISTPAYEQTLNENKINQRLLQGFFGYINNHNQNGYK